MKVNEWLASENIFSEISLIIPKIVSPADSSTLDLMFKTYQGERELFAPFENITVKQAADMVALKFGKIWEKYLEVESLAGVGDVSTTTETINQTETRNNTSDSVDKVAAYNELDLIDNSGNALTGSNDLLGETTRSTVVDGVSVDNRFNLLQLADANSIISKMLSDVANTISLSIY